MDKSPSCCLLAFPLWENTVVVHGSGLCLSKRVAPLKALSYQSLSTRGEDWFFQVSTQVPSDRVQKPEALQDGGADMLGAEPRARAA